MTRIVYDLAGEDPARRFSPFCWRIRLALAHKGLMAEFQPWRFTEKAALAFSGQDKVPILVDGARVVSDSWAIMAYLDETYDQAPLFEGPQALAHGNVLRLWTETVLHKALLPLIVCDVAAVLGPVDRAYFRQSREARFGMSLEQFAGDRAERQAALLAAQAPLRAALSAQAWLGGEAPSGVDLIVYAAFQWGRAVTATPLFKPDDAVGEWHQRMAEHYGLAAVPPD